MTASDRFSRIVSLVADMTREGGDPQDIATVAERHGMSVGELNADIGTLTLLGDRAIDSDWLLSLRIEQQADQLTLSSSGPFRRPVRLSPEEQLAIQLALALDPAGKTLAERLASLFAGNGVKTPTANPSGPQPEQLVDTVRFAVRERLALTIEYAGEGERDVRSRTIHPHQVAEFGIRTYVVAWAADIGAWRRFRLDRIISATLTTTRFSARTDFAPMESAADAFRPGPGIERVTVRFRREAAPWVTEFFTEHDVLEDGSVLVCFDASSTEWLTRRVLEFGADAEVVKPPHYRDAVRRAIA